MRSLAFLLLAATVGCGNPDNLVLGGFGAAYVNPVRSAISGVATVSPQGQASFRSGVIVLSTTTDLCKKVTDRTDYFRTATEASVSLLLYVPEGQVGTFFVDNSRVLAEVVVNTSPTDAGPGQSGAVFSAPPGRIDVAQASSATSGESRGSFDVFILDASGFGHEFAGRFKAPACPGLQQVLLP